MSSCRAAIRRPIAGLSQIRCLHQIPVTRTQLCNSRGLANLRSQERDALALLQLLQKRRQSTSSGKKATEQQPPMPPSKLILRALRQGLSFRPLFNAFRGQSLRALFRQSPEELIIALVLCVIFTGPSLKLVSYPC